MKVAVIGAGAAGFFSAIHVKENYPEAEVHILEKSSKVLSKVKISGGGRCNVTNGTRSIKELTSAYPRGGKVLKKLFSEFNTKHTWEWFEQRGVALKVEQDGRVFPLSDSSQDIIDCLLNESSRLGVSVRLKCEVNTMTENDDGWLLNINGHQESYAKVVVATGGSPKKEGLRWLKDLGHDIMDPVPSLFTFNMPNESVIELMGVVAPNAICSIQGSSYKYQGPVLITHWGMSGPAVLKLSAFGARHLFELDYHFKININWTGIINEDEVRSMLSDVAGEHLNKKIANVNIFSFPDRLWSYLLQCSGVDLDKKWSELGRKGLNKIVAQLQLSEYSCKGKTTFKEEFVTCGGVSFSSIQGKKMKSAVCNNLYFAGEVCDIDGITGGYNFQAAWTTAFVAGQLKE